MTRRHKQSLIRAHFQRSQGVKRRDVDAGAALEYTKSVDFGLAGSTAGTAGVTLQNIVRPSICYSSNMSHNETAVTNAIAERKSM